MTIARRTRLPKTTAALGLGLVWSISTALAEPERARAWLPEARETLPIPTSPGATQSPEPEPERAPRKSATTSAPTQRPSRSLPPKLHEAGALLALAPTLLAGTFYRRQDAWLGISGASNWVTVAVAPLAGWGYRVGVERRQPLLVGTQHELGAVAGTRLSGGSDYSARYATWSALFGAYYAYRASESLRFGGELGYVLGLASWLSFSDEYRDVYRDRYPDDRGTLGPESTSVPWPSHRAHALFTLSSLHSNWALRLQVGPQLGLGAGREWANLEMGQLPLLLRVLVGVPF